MNTPVVKLFAGVGLVYTGVFSVFDEDICRAETFAVVVNHIISEKYGGTALVKLSTDSRVIYCSIDPYSTIKKMNNEDLMSYINTSVEVMRRDIIRHDLPRVNLAINKYGVSTESGGLVFNLSNKSCESGDFIIVRANRVENLLRLHYG